MSAEGRGKPAILRGRQPKETAREAFESRGKEVARFQREDVRGLTITGTWHGVKADPRDQHQVMDRDRLSYSPTMTKTPCRCPLAECKQLGAR
jgi:hypothetical protein